MAMQTPEIEKAFEALEFISHDPPRSPSAI